MKQKRLLSLLLALVFSFGLLSGVTVGAQEVDAGTDERLTLDGVRENNVKAIDLGDRLITTDFTDRVRNFDNIDVNIKNLEGYTVKSWADRDKTDAVVNESTDEIAYIENVIDSLRKPVGAVDLDDVKSDEMVDVIVWLQEIPDALMDVYGVSATAKAAPYIKEGAKARNTINNTMSGKITWEYSEIFSGFAMTVNKNDIDKLASMDGVFAVIPDTMMYATNSDYKLDPDYEMIGMQDSRELLQIGAIHAETTETDLPDTPATMAPLTGEGVVVGVLDTGIDYNHPDLVDVYKGGYNFITSSVDYGRTTALGADAMTPMETTYAQWLVSGQAETSANGSSYYTSHGTHVSGTVAATGNNDDGYAALGMAPGVDLWVARVLGPYGSGATAGIIKAVEDFSGGIGAGVEGDYLPKADVINLSLGSDDNTAYGADIFALNNAVIAGVNVVTSAGNNGEKGEGSADKRVLYTLGTPGSAYLAMTVAASELGGTPEYEYFDAGIYDESIGGMELDAVPDLSLQGMGLDSVPSDRYPMYVSFSGVGDYLTQLNSIPDDSLSGYILVVNRGINFVEYLATARRTDAAALLIVNNTNGYITNMTIGGISGQSMPIFTVSQEARTIIEAVREAHPNIYLDLGTATITPAATLPAYFSSIGPIMETAAIKPDIIAPGWNIISTQPAFIINPDHDADDYSEAYAAMSGTSMSSPHVAGLTALMVQRYPNATPAEIKARLMNTAQPFTIEGETGTPASVMEVGAGFIDPYRALIDEYNTGDDLYFTVTTDIPGQTTGSVIANQTVSSLSFGYVEAGAETDTIAIDPSIDLIDTNLDCAYITSRFSNDADANDVVLNYEFNSTDNTIEVSVSIDDDAEEGLYEGYLLISPLSSVTYTMPWAVYVGEMPVPEFEFTIAFAERPIISTSENTSVRSAGTDTSGRNSNYTSLFFAWEGTWPTDSYGDSFIDVVLLDPNDYSLLYYCGSIDMDGAVSDGLEPDVFPNVFGCKALNVLNDFEEETVANGAYVIGILAGDELYGNARLGLVYTDGTGAMATTLTIDNLTSDSKLLIDNDVSVTTVTVSGNVYSPALALAQSYNFVWTELDDFWYGGSAYLCDQTWNIIGFNTTSDIYADASFQMNNIFSVGGNPWICDADGDFALNYAGITQAIKNGYWPFTINSSNHTIVGVEAFYWNCYVNPHNYATSWAMVGANKSAPVTPQFKAVEEFTSVDLTNGTLTATINKAIARSNGNDFTISYTLGGTTHTMTTTWGSYTAPTAGNGYVGTARWTFNPLTITGTQAKDLVVSVTLDGVTKTKTITLQPIAIAADGDTDVTVIHHSTKQLAVAVTPDDAGNKTVNWTSDNTSVVTVDSTGLITAVAVGSTTVTASLGAEAGKTVVFNITVDPLLVASLALPASMNMTHLDTYDLSEDLIITPADATDPSVTWDSNDKTVVTVDSDGVLTAVGVGTATVTVYSADGGQVYDTCVVTVDKIPVTGVVDPDGATDVDVDLVYTKTMQLEVTVSPNNASFPGLVWTSSNDSVITVTENGLIEAIDYGSADVVATSADDSSLMVTFHVTVTPLLVESIVIPSTMTMIHHDSLTISYLQCNVLPAKATDPSVTWTSSDSSVVAVENGKLVAKGVGTARITVTANDDSGVSTFCDITVNPKLVTDIVLSDTALTMKHHDEADISAVVSPFDATDRTFTWSSSDETVATVDASGHIIAVGVGTATITATANDDSGVTADCAVTVNPLLVSGITLSDTTLTLTHYGAADLTATVTPANATDVTYTWSSSDTSVATVDQSGHVVAIFPGTATITATANDEGGVTSTCAVTVLAIEPTEFVLSESNFVIDPAEQRAILATITPSNVSYPQVTWTSSDESIATVSQSGVVTGVSKGIVYITATIDAYPEFSETCRVIVRGDVGMIVNPGDTTSYTVTFNSQGGTAVAAQTVNENAIPAKPANPSQTFYTFGGWYKEADCVNEYNFDVALNADTTLYAKWIEGELPSTWARPEVRSAIEGGLVPLDLQANYKEGMSRIDFCRLAIRFIEVQTDMSIDAYLTSKGLTLADAYVDCDNTEVLAATALGIVNGIGNNTFAADRDITRAEAARMLALTCVALGLDISEAPQTAYADQDDIHSWANDAVNYMALIDVMTGTTEQRFDPTGVYTIETAIVTFERLNVYLAD